MIKLSDYVATYLKEQYGVKDIFLLSGGGAMHLNNSFGKTLNYICNHNEQATAIAAEGYARVNQKLAIVNVTTGPGGLNCLNGVFGQWTDSVPVLYISGQVKKATMLEHHKDKALRQLGDQEVDIISVVSPITKYAATVNNPNEIKYHIDKAISEATTGRFGPVWLNIPIDVQSAIIDETELQNDKPLDITTTKPASNDELQTVINKLQRAKRPLIIAGHGIRLSNTQAELKKLIAKLQIPTVTTFNSFDLLEEENPQFIGRIGTIGQRAGNFALQNADLVLCLGTRNNIRQVSYNYKNFAKNAFKIVVDIDKAELNKPTVQPDLAINADLKDFIPALLANAPAINTKKWLKWCQIRKEKYSPRVNDDYKNKNNTINPYFFTRTLSELMPENITCILANATAIISFIQTGKIKQGQRIFSNSGNASMGYDLPAAIGACVASDYQNTVCLAGDGSIMMNLQELQTIKHHNLPIKIFVINNNGYSSIKQTQTNFFNGNLTACEQGSGVSVPDFCELAKGFKLKSFKINTPDDVEKTVIEVLKLNEPVLCEVIVDPNQIFTPKLASKQLENGTLVSSSLEDLYPFLPDEEMRTNIIDKDNELR